MIHDDAGARASVLAATHGLGAVTRPRTPSAAVTIAAAAVLCAPSLLVRPPSAAATTTIDDDSDWREMLDRAVSASRGSSFTASMAIVGFSSGGPSLAEVSLAQDDGGAVTVGRAEAWMVGRGDGEAFLWQPDTRDATGPTERSRARQAGSLLRLGGVEPAEFSVDALLDKYTAELGGRQELRTGPATVVRLRERGGPTIREQLYIDAATDLVVRRDTFDLAGRPARIVALTELDVHEADDAQATSMPDDGDSLETTERGPVATLGPDDRDLLDQAGWVVRDRLGAGYELTAAYRLPEGCPDCDGAEGGPTLHLVYSDGLYTLSLYEQRGRVAEAALRGSVPVDHGDLHVHRWPGSEPERMVWSGAGRTFTLVSDAPHDELLDALAGLPFDVPPSLAHRVGRGLARVAGWLWPFD